MSSSTEHTFDWPKFQAACRYMLWRDPAMGGEKLAWLMMYADFEAYKRLGQPITGATYLKGKAHPEVRELGVGWFERAYRQTLPWWARFGGGILASVLLARSLRP